MILTSKGRYAVMALVDICINSKAKPMSLAVIAERQGIDLGYLEQLFSKLKKIGIVTSVRGPGGGYVLARHSSEIAISEVLFAVDESIKMTRCEGKNKSGCMQDKSRCITHHLWEQLENRILQFLERVTVQDVCNNDINNLLREVA